MLGHVVALGKKVIVCTIYYPCFSDWLKQKMSCAGIFAMNRIIKAEAAKKGLPVIDLAAIFDRNEDYANSIEPGVLGADKLTANIINIVRNHDWSTGYAVFADTKYTIASGEQLPTTHSGVKNGVPPC